MPVVVIVAAITVMFPAMGWVLYLGLGMAGVVAVWATTVSLVFVLMVAKYRCANRIDRLNEHVTLPTSEA